MNSWILTTTKTACTLVNMVLLPAVNLACYRYLWNSKSLLVHVLWLVRKNVHNKTPGLVTVCSCHTWEWHRRNHTSYKKWWEEWSFKIYYKWNFHFINRCLVEPNGVNWTTQTNQHVIITHSITHLLLQGSIFPATLSQYHKCPNCEAHKGFIFLGGGTWCKSLFQYVK